MEYRKILCSYLTIAFVLIGCGNSEKEEIIPLDPYVLAHQWPNLPEDFILGNPTGLGIDSDNNIVIFHRASRVWSEQMPETKIQENTIVKLDKETGELLNSWGADLFIMPHGLDVDKDNNIWVSDVALHQVFKFSPDGNLLLTLGKPKVPGNDAEHFNLPTDVAVADDGSFYVSDGYGNSRIVKFSKEGEYLFEWGTMGNKSGEFNIPHGIDLDKYGNIYVADRENNRIQKFDAQGGFITLWQNTLSEQLYSVTIDKPNDRLFGIDYMTVNNTTILGSDIFRFDLNINLQMQFGRTGFYDGPISRYHDIVIDDEGSIYVGDILGNKIQKFQLQKK
jgi:peptidylamidoglycolate lyase